MKRWIMEGKFWGTTTMEEELDVIERNKTWTLTELPKNKKVINMR